VSNRGSQENSEPFGNHAEGLFCWNFFKKEGFLKDLSNNENIEECFNFFTYYVNYFDLLKNTLILKG